MGLLIGVGAAQPTFPYNHYYGVEFDITVSNPNARWQGGIAPIFALSLKMRRCLQNDNGSVNYYLHSSDSTKRDTGSAAKLDGTDGQVMVELPDMHARFETDGNFNRIYFRNTHCRDFRSGQRCMVLLRSDIEPHQQ